MTILATFVSLILTIGQIRKLMENYRNNKKH